ncbi:unknown [Acinetobacter sp. CAG:196]|nr:unknown [Acinetobacter sp. CAG:196]
MFTVSIRVIAFMNSPEIVVYLYWISLLVLVIVAVDFIVSVFTSIAVEVSNTVLVFTSIETILIISVLASDLEDEPTPERFAYELTNGVSVPQVLTFSKVPVLFPIIFLPTMLKLAL